VEQTLDLLTKPHIPTCMGEGGAHNSTIDLVWRNMVAQIQGTFIGAEVDFGGSQGSDHALICGDSLLIVVMSPVGHLEQQGDDGSDEGNQRDRGGRGPQVVLTRSGAEQC
jgi:hypothetical protein